ncbi:MAG: hypothetical protein K0R71_189 [Bacillales bacterium]|jgi:hypothetical protein|nr:hypothetical protein [Bacillales bacterium]
MKGGKKMPPRRSPYFGKNQRYSPFASLFGEGSRGLFSLFGGQQSQKNNGIFGRRTDTQGSFDGIKDMISNTQKAIDTVQKVTPVVQQVRQYGPLIRNLPSMYKMLKVINSTPSDDSVDEEESKKSENVRLDSDESHEPKYDLNLDLIQTKNNKIEEKKSLPKFFTPGTRN